MYGGGRTADRRISAGELSEEWLMTRLTVRTVGMVDWEWKDWGISGVVRGSKMNWGGRGWIVEVYK